VLHVLLGIADGDALLAHPVVGASWEGFIVENLLAGAPEDTTVYFYRTAGGAELDLLLVFANRERWAVEVKRSLRPRPERGFCAACNDLKPDRRHVVYPGAERYPLGDGVEAVPLASLAADVLLHKSRRRRGRI